MTREEYLKGDWGGVPLNEDVDVWARDKHIFSTRTGLSIYFKTLDEMFTYPIEELGGKTVDEIIETWSEMPTLFLDADPQWHYK